MGLSSKSVERAGIGGKDDESAAAKREKDEIGHVRSPVYASGKIGAERVRFRLGRRKRDVRKR
jgi:hypothetical protein